MFASDFRVALADLMTQGRTNHFLNTALSVIEEEIKKQKPPVPLANAEETKKPSVTLADGDDAKPIAEKTTETKVAAPLTVVEKTVPLAEQRMSLSAKMRGVAKGPDVAVASAAAAPLRPVASAAAAPLRPAEVAVASSASGELSK